MKKFLVEVRNIEGGVFEAAFVRAEPETGVRGPVTFTTRDFSPQKAVGLMADFLKGLGVEGIIEADVITNPITIKLQDTSTPKDHLCSVGIPSHTTTLVYEVTFDPEYRFNGNNGYTCECQHFIHRLDVYNDDGLRQGGICKHIEEAIEEYNLGLNRPPTVNLGW